MKKIENMAEKKLILIGGGGHCRSVIDVIEASGREILGIIEQPQFEPDNVLGYPVLGSNDVISRYVDEAEFVITVGQIKSAAVRQHLVDEVVKAGGRFAIIISPLAHVSHYASIGEGTVVMHNVVVNAGAKVGSQCILNTRCTIEHDTVVGDFCHISTHAVINGGSSIGDRVFIGSNTVVAQVLSITSDVVVGAGGVVCQNIENSGIYCGVPAKLKQKK